MPAAVYLEQRPQNIFASQVEMLIGLSKNCLMNAEIFISQVTTPSPVHPWQGHTRGGARNEDGVEIPAVFFNSQSKEQEGFMTQFFENKQNLEKTCARLTSENVRPAAVLKGLGVFFTVTAVSSLNNGITQARFMGPPSHAASLG